MTMINNVLDKLEYLKLRSAYVYLKELHINDNITSEELKGINKVLKKEVEEKEKNTKLYNVKVAGFPYIKTLADYDFTFQPSLKEERINEISNSNFYEDATNVVFIGNPGVGKTHLAISIGNEAAIKRNSVYFIKFSKLIYMLKQAYNEGALEKRLKVYFKYKVLIIDEVGFNEISSLESKLFFQLIDIRYTKRSTIFTSNLTFDKWSTILGGDEMITKAILDRILHYSYLFNITGPSYRIKDKIKLRPNGDDLQG